MVGPEERHAQIVRSVEQLYDWLARELDSNRKLSGSCAACGKCCDFDAYDHRLYITVPELIYLAANVPEGKLEVMASGRCPYNHEGKCTIHELRFASCRIFYCMGDSDFQSNLTERALAKLKAICEELDIPYRYMDLRVALNDPDIIALQGWID
jgi:Fe-S-cluster containining protein